MSFQRYDPCVPVLTWTPEPRVPYAYCDGAGNLREFDMSSPGPDRYLVMADGSKPPVFKVRVHRFVRVVRERVRRWRRWR